jgi:hypothetical protein
MMKPATLILMITPDTNLRNSGLDLLFGIVDMMAMAHVNIRPHTKLRGVPAKAQKNKTERY